MVESTIILLDNSEWMRNGDYIPTRMLAQQDAADTICYAKSEQHPQNTLAVMSSAGSSPEVQIPLTSAQDGLLNAIRSVKLSGKCDLATSLRVAQLVLRNRENKAGGQRIVIFVGSPVEEDSKQLIRLAKQLKKSNIACDVVSFGEVEQNAQILTEFIEAVNKSGNSHLVAVPAGPHLLSDVLISTPIVMGENSSDSSTTSTVGGGMSMGGGDVEDPMIAEAIRASLMTHAQEATTTGNDATTAATDATDTDVAMLGEEDDEEALLQHALMMSMQAEDSCSGNTTKAAAVSTPATPTPAPATETGSTAAQEEEDDEEEALRLALQMSMADGGAGETSEPAATPMDTEDDDVAAMMADPEFLQSLYGDLPGVDLTDSRIQDVLSQVTQEEEEEGSGDAEEEKKE
eukprot:CAMPEP_0177667454 /NCGR_PEP_ID=MMETSP0447-20121125/22133_1 /TAXON_ID=0 /ORGANISM="Stygamoeba regulata, Strain BSH-02190019" /LENGTH=402 /DNA_ID=CAMNT_0019173689 /DNA_START=89 /DNA_END=1297 /DNA_ORIENTATION=-